MSEALEKIYTVPQVAGLVGCSQSFAWKQVHTGSLRSFKMGRLRKVTASALADWWTGLQGVGEKGEAAC